MSKLLLTTVAAGLVILTAFVRVANAQEKDTRACIAIVLPAVQGVEGNATEVATAVRELFTNFLNGPAIQIMPLDTRLVSQAPAEAKQKGCGHLLLTTLTRKRGGSGALGRIVGQAGATMAYHLPGAGSVGSAVARSAAIASAQAVNDLATGTRAKDELKIEYRLSPASGGRDVIKLKEEKMKASVDGEDLLTPLVQKISEVIATNVTKSGRE